MKRAIIPAIFAILGLVVSCGDDSTNTATNSGKKVVTDSDAVQENDSDKSDDNDPLTDIEEGDDADADVVTDDDSGDEKPEVVDGMAIIPAGSFKMGCVEGDEICNDPDALGFVKSENPQHEVQMDSFLIGSTEVTVAEYRKCVEAGACANSEKSHFYRTPADDAMFAFCNFDSSREENHPMNCVSFAGAKAYCEWKDMRLPTEAEWEYVARAGVNDKIYVTGNDKPTCEDVIMDDGKGDNVGCLMGSTWPVASKEPNKFGVYDMSGNVWEWVGDYYAEDYYSKSPAENPKGPETGTKRIIRGGSWMDPFFALRISMRRPMDPNDERHTNPYHGFRCAADIQK